MVDYVVKLTKDATKVWKDDHEKLRAAGFEDKAILQITLIASWFNYINRVADSLGVGREPLFWKWRDARCSAFRTDAFNIRPLEGPGPLIQPLCLPHSLATRR